MVTTSSQRAVEETLDSLRDHFGDVPVVEETWQVDAATYEQTRKRANAGTVGGAGAWVRRADGAALMVREIRGGGEAKESQEAEQGWSEPAGKQESNESLVETAVRETREETGVTCRIVGVVRAAVAVHEHGNHPPLYRLVVVFDARYEAGEARPNPGEIAEIRWVYEHPDDLRYPAVAEFPL